MATAITITKICDINGKTMDEDENTEVPFTWDGRNYKVDVCPDCLETITMNTIGGLIEVAEQDTGPAKSVAKKIGKTTTLPASTSGKAMAQGGKRRYSFDEYLALWPTTEDGYSQLQCPHCAFHSSVSGSTKEHNARKQAALREHLADEHKLAMWAMAADAKGDAYDPERARVA